MIVPFWVAYPSIALLALVAFCLIAVREAESTLWRLERYSARALDASRLAEVGISRKWLTGAFWVLIVLTLAALLLVAEAIGYHG